MELGESREDLAALDLALERLREDGTPSSYFAVEPAEVDGPTAALVAREYGPNLVFDEQGWLVWAAAGLASTPDGFVLPVGGGLELLGAAGKVECEGSGRVRVEALRWRGTMRALAMVLAGGAGYGSLPCLTVVADRFDRQCRRVERVVGHRCVCAPFEDVGEWWAVDLQVRGERLWWSADLGGLA